METKQSRREKLLEKNLVEIEDTSLVKVELNSKFAYRKYVAPHNVTVKANQEILFFTANTSNEEKNGFHLLIDNRDGFFVEENDKAAQDLVNFNVTSKASLKLKIKSGLSRGEEKYYSVYSYENNNYADDTSCSPPKITGDS